jgi:hypothetical protein
MCKIIYALAAVSDFLCNFANASWSNRLCVVGAAGVRVPDFCGLNIAFAIYSKNVLETWRSKGNENRGINK